MPPEDDFRRDRDPRTRRNATVAGLAVLVCLAALLAGVLVARVQPTSPAPQARPSPRPSVQATPPSLSPTPVPNLPVLGSRFSAAYDARTHQLVTFGGVDSYDTTWLWNGRGWALARPSSSPPGRFNAAAAYDPLTGVVMLYGGRLGPGQLVEDTWAWDGTTWRRLDAGTSALPSYAVMAWDDITSQMILVSSDSGASSGTWTWDGSHWVRQPRGDLPPATYILGMAVDPVTHRFLAAGCCAVSGGVSSTLTWDGAAWHQLNPPTAPGFTVAMVLDPASGRLLLFGDPSLAPEVWSWTGQAWTRRPNVPLPEFPAAAVTDTDLGGVVIVGSVAEPVQGHPQPVHVWSLIGGAWQPFG
jgi:hypothetical protein